MIRYRPTSVVEFKTSIFLSGDLFFGCRQGDGTDNGRDGYHSSPVPSEVRS